MKEIRIVKKTSPCGSDSWYIFQEKVKFLWWSRWVEMDHIQFGFRYFKTLGDAIDKIPYFSGIQERPDTRTRHSMGM
jgi:hypothetical protein